MELFAYAQSCLLTQPLISIEKTPHYWVLRQKRCINSSNVIVLTSLGYFMRFHKIRQAFSFLAVAVVEAVIPNPKLRLLDQISEVMRLKHYSIRTEQTYSDWVRRCVQFHPRQRREELLPAEPKIEAFLSELAVKGQVAVSTQNQAFNARRKNANIERPTSNAEPRTKGKGAGCVY